MAMWRSSIMPRLRLLAGMPTSWERTKRSIRSSASEPLISLIIGRIATSMSWASLSNSPISTRLRCDASLRISRNLGSDIAFDPLAWTMSL